MTALLRPTLRAGLAVAALVVATALNAGCRFGLTPPGSGSPQRLTVRALDTMRFDPADVEPDRPFRDMGID